MWDVATATFADNFPDAIVKTARLESIKPGILRQQIGDIDLILASPECTNHTCAKGSAPRSEASRATALQILRFARAFEPRWIVMENVVHMRPWFRYNEMKSALAELGYHVSDIVLNASDFGVPQARKRLFILCDKETPPARVTPVKGTRRKSAKSILDKRGHWHTSPVFSEKRANATLERAARGFASVGYETPFLLVYYGSDGSGGWQPLDRPLRTITTVDRFALVEPSEEGHRMRMLQVPELTKAMGLTEEYRLPVGTRRQKIHLLGNGVCPPVMKAVVGSLTSA